MEQTLSCILIAYSSTFRSALCSNGGLLGTTGGDGTTSGSQLHPHILCETQPSWPCSSGLCRVGQLPPSTTHTTKCLKITVSKLKPVLKEKGCQCVRLCSSCWFNNGQWHTNFNHFKCHKINNAVKFLSWLCTNNTKMIIM